MVSEFLLSSDMGKEFSKEYHQDVDARKLALNTAGRSSWGGSETLLPISQVFNVNVTMLSFICPEGMVPYDSKYWPVAYDPPACDSLSAPSANHLLV